MDQLSGADSVFLALERPGQPQHLGGLVILDPSEAPDFGFERLIAVADERMRLAPRFTRRLREVSGGLDRAWLVDDPAFDVRRHVQRVGVPAPGSPRELAELVGHLFAPPLERGRPLWEMWLIEGVAEGSRVALFTKSHRCLQGGIAGACLGELLCDLELSPRRPPKASPHEAAPDPGDLRVALRAVRNLAARPVATARLGGDLLSHGVTLLRSARDPEAPPLPFSIPKVSFNRDPGPRRAFAYASVPLEPVKAIRKHFDVKVNDVVLALAGSAVRRYLLSRDELPKKSLVATLAVSSRGEDDSSGDDAVAPVAVPWATERPDPVARLLRIHRAVVRAKDFARRHDTQLLPRLGEAMLPGLLGLTLRNLGAGATTAGNAVVSSVRATPAPLYLAGAKVESMVPLSILASGQGLDIAALRYCGRIDIGFTVDPDLVPEPWQLAEGIPLALEELTAAMTPDGTRKKRRRRQQAT